MTGRAGVLTPTIEQAGTYGTPIFPIHERGAAAAWANKSLQRTLRNVAKIRDYNRLFRVAQDGAVVVERR